MLRFGTDGVRGLANAELTPELVLALGRAAARVLGPRAQVVSGRAPFIVGRDTRRSGPLLQAALSAGMAAEGFDVVDVGVLPTPAVAYLSAERGVPAAVISASHNPFWDNGIKFFGPGGGKLDDDTERALETTLVGIAGGTEGDAKRLTGAELGTTLSDHGAGGRYEQYLLNCLHGRRLGGLRVALDCAHGAAFASAPRVFRAAGAELVAILGDRPDGTNINQGYGSTDPQRLAEAVLATRADIGLAFDGDADRVIAVDGDGNVVDGDRIIALFAGDLAARGLLDGGTVVVTVMTNLGFHQAMAAAGVKVHTVNVGDRYVLEALDGNGWALGGEQSGHIIFRSLATTGDGVLSGLLLADLLVRTGSPLASMAAEALQRSPQVLVNVRVAQREGLKEATAVWAEVDRAQAELGDSGRVLLRPSGTEPVVRVMVEAPSEEQAREVADRLAAVLSSCLGPVGTPGATTGG